MVDEKNPEKTENTATDVADVPPEEEVLLDKTRMDIDVFNPKEEPTSADGGTDIRVNSGLASKPKVSLFSTLTSLVNPLVSSISKGMRGIKAPVSLGPFLKRLLGIGAALPFFYLLGQSVLGAFGNHAPSAWILLAVLVMAVLFSVASLLLRWGGAWAFVFPFSGILALSAVHFFLYSGTDPLFFTLLGRAPSLVANELFAGLLGVELLLIIFGYPGSLLPKIFTGFLVLAGIANFVFNIYSKVWLEASWNGVGPLAGFPPEIQPTFLILVGLIPLLFITSLLWLVVCRRSEKRGWIGANLVLLFFAVMLGQVLPWKGRLPDLLAAITPPPLPVASAILRGDGSQGAPLIQVSTKNFKAHALADDWARAHFSLSTEKDKYLLQATDTDGFPFFVDRRDLVVTVNGQEVKWSMKRSAGKKQGDLISLLSSPPPAAPFSITVPEKTEYAATEPISFTFPADTALDFYEITIDGQAQGQKKSATGGNVNVDIAGLAAGPHTAEISATDVLGNTSRASLAFTIVAKPGLAVQSPLSGDAFSDSLPVAVDLSVPQGFQAGPVHFLIDDKEIGMKDSPPYQDSLTTTDLPEGNHVLKVTTILTNPADPTAASQELTQTVPVTKADHPQAFFVRPTLGEFLSTSTPVEISVAADSKGVLPSSVELIANDAKIHEWNAPPYTFDWDTSGLSSGDYVLKLKAKSPAGIQTSDWVGVRTGQGDFQIAGQSGDPHYQKVVFILDASISQNDLWGTKSKWEWEQGFFSTSIVGAGLKGAEVGVIVSGSNVFYQHADCGDADWVLPPGPYNSRSVRTVLKKRDAKGVFALNAALDQALTSHPKKIIVLADGGDACAGNKMPLVSKIRSGGVSIDVMALGPLSAHAKSSLEKLAEAGGGEMIVVSSGADLDTAVAQALFFRYKIFEGDKVVLEGAVDHDLHPLKPGDYTLKVSMDPPMPEQQIVIRNGVTTTVDLK